jgi:hypothetical protein
VLFKIGLARLKIVLALVFFFLKNNFLIELKPFGKLFGRNVRTLQTFFNWYYTVLGLSHRVRGHRHRVHPAGQGLPESTALPSDTRQRGLGTQCIGKSFLPSTFSRALGKVICRVSENTLTKKSSRYGVG